MWRRVDLVRTDVSEERVAYIFRVVRLALIATDLPPNVLIQCSFEL
jgi:hypothetical protein